jgi:hypothetical protein
MIYTPCAAEHARRLTQVIVAAEQRDGIPWRLRQHVLSGDFRIDQGAIAGIVVVMLDVEGPVPAAEYQRCVNCFEWK